MKINKKISIALLATLFLVVIISLSSNFVSAGWCDCTTNQCDYTYEYPEYTEDYGTCRSCYCVPYSSLCGNGAVDSYEVCDDGGTSCSGTYGSGCSDCTDDCSNSIKDPYCGDGNLDSGYESCDYGTANTNTAPTLPYSATKTETKYCKLDCSAEITVSSPHCGDAVLQSANGEQCDDGKASINGCTATYGSTCNYCDASCKLQSSASARCGDNIINGNEQCDGTAAIPSTFTCNSMGMVPAETNPGQMSCNSQCNVNPTGCRKIDGWFVISGTWSDASGKLVSTDSAVIHSDPFDVSVGKEYILSANVPSGQVTLSLSTTCISSITFKEEDCGISSGDLIFNSDGSKTKSITLAPNAKAMNSGLFFKGVKLIIRTTGGATIEDISLREKMPGDIEFDQAPSTQFSGCCPSDYCWNGTVCVNSDVWMTNATYPAIWSLDNPIKLYNLADPALADLTPAQKAALQLFNNHVNTAERPEYNGYRCVAQKVLNTKGTPDPSDDATIKVASWTPSQIKYDWNYKNSGYCANATDCFVNYANDFAGGLSKGCTPNGTIVNDAFVGGSGNHYCHLGEWTTKSYIIASLLQEMMTSTSSDKEYTLSCYDDLDLVYNSLPTLPDESPEEIRVASACVLTQPDQDSRLQIKTNSQIITGVVLQDDSRASSNSFVDKVIIDYERSFGTGTISKPAISCTETNAPRIGSTSFTQCVSTSKGDLFVYYDSTYKYFILSNKRVTGIEGTGWLESLWVKISGFFENVFGLALDLEPYDSVSYTTSYDRIYITRTADIDVTAIEEAKYDEIEKTTVDVLYVKYDGTTINNNPINTAEINRLLDEQTVLNSNQEIVSNVIRTDYLPENAPQEVTIKSHQRTNMWQYFTTILRVQD